MAPTARPSAGYDGATDCVRRGIGFSGVIGFAFCSSGPIVSRSPCAANTVVTVAAPRRMHSRVRREDIVLLSLYDTLGTEMFPQADSTLGCPRIASPLRPNLSARP